MTKKKPQVRTSRTHKTYIKFYKNGEPLPIGLTLETKDKYLPHNSKTSQVLKESRPVIIVAKQKNKDGKEDFVVIPTGTQKSKNMRGFYKFGIARVKNTIEIEDDEGKPIQRNSKFKVTNNSSQMPIGVAEELLDYNLQHTKQSSENQKKLRAFFDRGKGKKKKG